MTSSKMGFNNQLDTIFSFDPIVLRYDSRFRMHYLTHDASHDMVIRRLLGCAYVYQPMENPKKDLTTLEQLSGVCGESFLVTLSMMTSFHHQQVIPLNDVASIRGGCARIKIENVLANGLDVADVSSKKYVCTSDVGGSSQHAYQNTAKYRWQRLMMHDRARVYYATCFWRLFSSSFLKLQITSLEVIAQ